MPSFPRSLKPANISPFRVGTGLVARGQTGKDQLRSVVHMGVEWDEVWPPMFRGDPAVEALLAFIQDAYNRLAIFDIQHLNTPGSGRAPNGAGGGTPLVNGAGQTGISLLTDGWSINITNVVRAGDVIRIAGLSPLYLITADANSSGIGQGTLSVSPPIVLGSSPGDNAPITRTGNVLNAYISAVTLPASSLGDYIDGMSVTFREALL